MWSAGGAAGGSSAGAAFGVYLHVPFCSRRCDYCAFATWDDREHLVGEYLRACAAHARAWRESGSGGSAAVGGAGGPAATSVFVGGGTPNLVPAEELLAVMDEFVLARSDGSDGPKISPEITIECNPDHVSASQMRAYADWGVNRISLGVQSLRADVLAALGREHQPAAVLAAVDAIRSAGIERLNVDLIFGAAGESLEDWRASLEGAIGLEPDHISAYGLTVEAGTPLADDEARWPDDDDQADKYLLADDLLGAAGFENYEISNWARAGARCRHNELYWSGGNYIGFGAAAHSHCDGRRWWNVRTPERYVTAVGELPNFSAVEAGCEVLDEQQRRRERLQLEIRASGGVAVEDLPPGLLGAASEVAQLLIVGEDGRARLTRRGRLLANEVARLF